MNTNTNTTNPYARKVGIFGSTKQLIVTTVSGLNTATQDSVELLTGITGAGATAGTLLKEATGVWGETILEDLRADQAEDRIIRDMERHHRQAELENLKAELAKVKATKAKAK